MFAPVVAAARQQIEAGFGPARRHSAYLYGSIPRGSAEPGRSDLDILLALRYEPGHADRRDADQIRGRLDARFAQIDGAGIELSSAASLLSEAERYDGGWFVACLCTPLLGDDLAADLPRYRPTSQLARETNGNLGELLPRWGEQAARPGSEAGRRALSRRVGRRLVRSGMTLVMDRWNGWTSDLAESAEIFGRYYPGRAGQMATAAVVARTPRAADPAVLSELIDDLGPWLADEYTARHGRRTPRPVAGPD